MSFQYSNTFIHTKIQIFHDLVRIPCWVLRINFWAKWGLLRGAGLHSKLQSILGSMIHRSMANHPRPKIFIIRFPKFIYAKYTQKNTLSSLSIPYFLVNRFSRLLYFTMNKLCSPCHNQVENDLRWNTFYYGTDTEYDQLCNRILFYFFVPVIFKFFSPVEHIVLLVIHKVNFWFENLAP